MSRECFVSHGPFVRTKPPCSNACFHHKQKQGQNIISWLVYFTLCVEVTSLLIWSLIFWRHKTRSKTFDKLSLCPCALWGVYSINSANGTKQVILYDKLDLVVALSPQLYNQSLPFGTVSRGSILLLFSWNFYDDGNYYFQMYVMMSQHQGGSSKYENIQFVCQKQT